MRLKIILISGAFAALACVGQLRSEDWLGGQKDDLTRNGEGFAAVREKVEAEKNKRMDDKAAELKRRIQQMEQRLKSSKAPPSAGAAASISRHLESAKSLLSGKPNAARIQEASKRVEDAARIYQDQIAPAAKARAPGDNCAQRERILKENIQPNDPCVDDSGAKRYH